MEREIRNIGTERGLENGYEDWGGECIKGDEFYWKNDHNNNKNGLLGNWLDERRLAGVLSERDGPRMRQILA